AGSAALRLRREERLEYPLEQLRRYAAAVVGDADPHLAGRGRAARLTVGAASGVLADPDRHLAFAFDRVARVHGEVHDHAFELRGARAHRPDAGVDDAFERDANAERAFQ